MHIFTLDQIKRFHLLGVSHLFLGLQDLPEDQFNHFCDGFWHDVAMSFGKEIA